MEESALEKALREARGGPAARRAALVELVSTSLHAQKARGQGLALAVWRAKDGRLLAAAFTTRERARAWNGDLSAAWMEVPAAWVARQAAERGVDALVLDPPRGLELGKAEVAALAEGRVPELPPPPAAAGLPRAAEEAPAPAPPPPEPALARWTIGAPGRRVPPEALEYLRVVLESVDEVSEAWFFAAEAGEEVEELVLGLRVELPPERWDGLIASLEQLHDVPGFPDGLSVCALGDETLAAARRYGLRL